MEACPETAVKMVEAKLFLELLVCLLADPARLDGAGEIPDRRICGQVREIIFALAAGAMIADQPGFFPGACAARPKRRCVGAGRRRRARAWRRSERSDASSSRGAN